MRSLFGLALGLMFGLLAAGMTSAEPERPASFTNSIGMHFIGIPAGSYQRGSNPRQLQRARDDFERITGKPFDSAWNRRFLKRETPAHTVQLTQSFYLASTEVTLEQFGLFVGETGYVTAAEKSGGGWVYQDGRWQVAPGASWINPFGDKRSFEELADHPVVQVSWHDAAAFIDWLNKKEGIQKYRLPTEAEWEFACRNGGLDQLYSWSGRVPAANVADQTSARQFAWPYSFLDYADGYAETAPVGSFPGNELGLLDMLGNVWEWCADTFDEYQPGSHTNPLNDRPGDFKVIRGGSWCQNPLFDRCALRGKYMPANYIDFLGFRVACDK